MNGIHADKIKTSRFIKGVLYLEMPEFDFFLISRYFYNLNLKYMHIGYTVKKQFFFLIKRFLKGVRDSTERPKLY